MLSVLVHQCPSFSGFKGRDCGSGPVFQESNLDILNIDMSDHTLQLEQLQAEGYDCSQLVSLMQLLEWSFLRFLQATEWHYYLTESFDTTKLFL